MSVTFVIWPQSHSGLGNATPRGDVVFAVLIDGMVFARSIHGLNVRELVLALLDSSLIFVFGLFGAIRNACHGENWCKPRAHRRTATQLVRWMTESHRSMA